MIFFATAQFGLFPPKQTNKHFFSKLNWPLIYHFAKLRPGKSQNISSLDSTLISWPVKCPFKDELIGTALLSIIPPKQTNKLTFALNGPLNYL